MNVVIDDAEEVYAKTKTRKKLSKLLLKGDCITLIKRADEKNWTYKLLGNEEVVGLEGSGGDDAYHVIKISVNYKWV